MIKQVPAGFTLQDLRAYLHGEEDAKPPEGYQTAAEWSHQFGIHLYTMYRLLREAQNVGLLLRQTGKLERIDGQLTTVCFYAFSDNDHDHDHEGGAEGQSALQEDD